MRSKTAHDPYRSGLLAPPRLRLDVEPTGEPVRVLAFVDRYVPFQNAGAESMLHALLRHLVEQGHEVRVCTAMPYDAIVPSVVEGVYVYPGEAADDFAGGWADVLVGHLAWTTEVVNCAHRHRLPLIYIMHNDSQIDYWRLTVQNVTAMVWNSEWIRAANLARHPTWRAHPSIICRPPVLLDDYALDRDPAGGEFVTLVNPNPAKGGATFYDVAKRERGRRFLAVTGAYGTQLAPQSSNVVVQPQTASMRDDVYERTRVLFMPSSYESWGMAAVEAMCSGIPVVAHPTPGLREALGDAAWFVDRDDTDGYIAALGRLDDPARYALLSDRARDRASLLDRQSRADLEEWSLLVRRCAAVERVA